ncbi:hypothetical protein BC830DRAFT_1115218 [Chytriomyces sp. MP71]|nr:hypothetical protein BC830DRAFT_1115218 [Chytriomyces sp. MP71]
MQTLTKDQHVRIASECTAKARDVAAHSADSAETKREAHGAVHALVSTAVCALETALSAPATNTSSSLLISLADELALRVAIADLILTARHRDDSGALARAESHVNKATLVAQKLGSTASATTLHLKYLQILILKSQKNLKACYKLLKEAALMADQSHRDWFYFFTSIRVDLLLQERDTKTAHSVLTAVASQVTANDDLDIKISFLLRRMEVCISARDSRASEAVISADLEPIFSSLPPFDNTFVPLVGTREQQAEHFQLHYALLKVMHLCQRGNRRDAKPVIELLCTRVDAWDAADHSYSAKVATPLNPTRIELLSRRQMAALIHLTAGSFFRDFEASRAISELKSCREAVQHALHGGPDTNDETVRDVESSRMWFMEIYLLASHYLCEAYLLKGDLKKSKDVCPLYSLAGRCFLNDQLVTRQNLNILIEHIHKSAPQHSALLQRYMPTILLDWGFINQAAGNFDQASRCYFGASALANDVSKRGVESALIDEEVAAVASFCNILILLGSKDVGKVEMAKKILADVRRDIKQPLSGVQAGISMDAPSPSDYDHMKAFTSLSHAMVAHGDGEIKKTKMHLLECLRSSEVVLSNQLKTTTLVLLGNLFLETDLKQTEKMTATAYKLCKKSGNETIVRVCKSLLDEIARRNGGGGSIDKRQK